MLSLCIPVLLQDVDLFLDLRVKKVVFEISRYRIRPANSWARMTREYPDIFLLFGAAGDLSHRLILPALIVFALLWVVKVDVMLIAGQQVCQ